jgi:ankyrin repeat protein
MKPRWLMLVGLSVLVIHVAVIAGQDRPQPGADQQFRSGLNALEARRLDEAVATFEQYLKLVPRDDAAAYNLACAYSLKQDRVQALNWLSRAADWGYEDVDHMFGDADLAFIREQPGFWQVVDDIQRRLPTSARRRRPAANAEPDRSLELVAMVRSDAGSGAAIVIGRQDTRLVLATANHVVRRGGADARRLEVQLKTPAPRWHAAVLLPPVPDQELDIAFIAIDGIVGRDLRQCSLPFGLGGDSAALRRGDIVFPVGYPNGILWAMPLTPDRVSQVLPSQLSFESQFIRVGFSGGALISGRGQIVGMITADEPPLGRAVPLASIAQAARAMKYTMLLATGAEPTPSPLHVAAKTGNISDLRRLLDNCADANTSDVTGRTALHEAAAQGSGDAIQSLVDAGAALHAWALIQQDGTDREWGTALHVAAESGSAAAVKALLARGVDVDIRTLRRYDDDRAIVQRRTALQVAAQHDRGEVVEALLAAGAAAEPFGDDSPLTIAAASRSATVVKVLIRHGAITAARQGTQTRSALHAAAASGSVEIVRLLVGGGFEVDVRDSNNATPLHAAAENGHLEAVEFLLSLKADVNAQGYLANTPLHLAAERARTGVVKLLLARGADPNRLNERRIAPLTLALRPLDLETIAALVNAKADIDYALHSVLDDTGRCRGDRLCLQRLDAAARILIDGGADLALNDTSRQQPLHLAAANGLTDMVALLLKRGATAAVADRRDEDPPLHRAAERGHLEVVRQLLSAGAPVNQTDSSGRTALYRAVYEKRPSVVDLLLRSGANPDIATSTSYSQFDNTPVAKAASGPPEILRLLLAAGADPRRGGESVGYSPLHRAASDGSLENVRLLLQAGARPSVSNNGFSPLHEVVRNSLSSKEKIAPTLIELLVRAGNAVDARDGDGLTPLHMAASQASTVAVTALLSWKADVNIADKCGSTPLAASLRAGEERALKVAELLLNAGADVNVKSCGGETLLQTTDRLGYLRLRQLFMAKGGR